MSEPKPGTREWAKAEVAKTVSFHRAPVGRKIEALVLAAYRSGLQAGRVEGAERCAAEADAASGIISSYALRRLAAEWKEADDG